MCDAQHACVRLPGRALEKTLDRLDMSAVGEEHDDVVVALHDRVMVRHDDLVAAHDGANQGAVGQLDFLDALAAHARDELGISKQTRARPMQAALASARVEAADIDYVNAHGTATLQNDAVETAAIKAVFGERAHAIPVSSTKSMHGHLLGAAGALEFVISVMCLRRGTVPPTMHLDSPDPDCDLDYVAGQARRGMRLNRVMSNSFAFGGTNAVLIVESAAPN